MDKLVMLLLLILIISGFYWFQYKIELFDDIKYYKKKHIKYKKIIDTDTNNSLINTSIDNISIGSLNSDLSNFDDQNSSILTLQRG